MAKKSERIRTKWSIRQLERYIQEEALDTSKVVFTKHALDKMKLRKITMGCALHTLRKGKINLQPEMNFQTGDLMCRMELYVAGLLTKIVVAISDEDPSLIVVTAI